MKQILSKPYRWLVWLAKDIHPLDDLLPDAE